MADQESVEQEHKRAKEPVEDFIKVKLNKETVWAVRLGPDKAEIRNSPLDDRVNFMDIVEISGNRFVKVLERPYLQVMINYEYSDDTIGEQYPKMAQYLRDNDLLIEGYVAGAAAVDYKKDVSEEKVREILEKSPMKITNIEFQ